MLGRAIKADDVFEVRINAVQWRRNGNALNILASKNPHEQYGNANRYDMTDELARSAGVQYGTQRRAEK